MMAEMLRQVLNDDALNLDASGLELAEGGASWVRWGAAIVSNQGIGKYENLSRVRRIRKRLNITRHAGVEDNFAGHRCLCGEARSLVFRAILEHELHLAQLVHVASRPQDKVLY